MLPLNLGYAMTIHKSQGLSLDKVIINIGNREFASGLTYTALSRSRAFEKIAFLPFYNYARFKRGVNTGETFEARKKQDEIEKKSDEDNYRDTEELEPEIELELELEFEH